MAAYYLPHQTVPYETPATGPTVAQYATYASQQQQQPTFAFKKRFERIDWKRIGIYPDLDLRFNAWSMVHVF